MSEQPPQRVSGLASACRLVGGLLVVAVGAIVALDLGDPTSLGLGAVAVLSLGLLVAGDVLAGEHRQAAGMFAAAVGLLCFYVGVARAIPVLQVGGLVLTLAAGVYVVALGVGADPLAAPLGGE